MKFCKLHYFNDPQNKIVMSKKIILDACCGSRMFWFDKKNPNVLFIDNRSETVWMCFMKLPINV